MKAKNFFENPNSKPTVITLSKSTKMSNIKPAHTIVLIVVSVFFTVLSIHNKQLFLKEIALGVFIITMLISQHLLAKKY